MNPGSIPISAKPAATQPSSRPNHPLTHPQPIAVPPHFVQAAGGISSSVGIPSTPAGAASASRALFEAPTPQDHTPFEQTSSAHVRYPLSHDASQAQPALAASSSPSPNSAPASSLVSTSSTTVAGTTPNQPAIPANAANVLSPTTAKIAWRRKLVLVMVGLPARGKSYISYKLLGYLKWRGLNAALFNVGRHRRVVAEKLAAPQSSDFFNPNNQAAKSARDEIAMEVLDCMLDWLASGGDVSIFDATNTTAARRKAVLARCHSRSLDLRVIFLESICDDQTVLENNYSVKVRNSPDYKDIPLEEALTDLRNRVKNYEKVYETISDDDLSYIKLHNLASKVICNKIHGLLAHSIAAYCMNIHLQPRSIFFVRAGHSDSEESNQQTKDRQILKLDEAHHSTDAADKNHDFHIPYTVAMAANLDSGGKKFAARLTHFITRKVEEYNAARELREKELAEAIRHSQENGPANTLLGHSTTANPPPASPTTNPTAATAPASSTSSTSAATAAFALNLSPPNMPTGNSNAGNTAPPLTLPSGFTQLTPSNSISSSTSLSVATNSPLDHHLPLVVFTSTLPRAIQTAQELKERAYIFEPHSSLNMMDTGVLSGMSINEIREKMPEELEKWQRHKFRYRFPGGESQADRAKSLEPLVFELERQTLPVLVVSHMSTLQVLLGFFYGSKRSVDSYYSLWIPQHTVLELVPNNYGWIQLKHDLSDDAYFEEYESDTSLPSSPVRSPRHQPVPTELKQDADEVERFNLQVVGGMRKASRASLGKDPQHPQQTVSAQKADGVAAAASATSSSTSSKNNLDRPRSLLKNDRSISNSAMIEAANEGNGSDGLFEFLKANKKSNSKAGDVTQLGQAMSTNFYED